MTYQSEDRTILKYVMENISNFDNYSVKRSNDLSSEIDYILDNFDLWLADVVSRINSCEREIILDGFHYRKSMFKSSDSFFHDFCKVPNDNNIEKKLETFLKKDTRKGTKRKKSFSIDIKCLDINKKPKLNNIVSHNKILKLEENEPENSPSALNEFDENQNKEDMFSPETHKLIYDKKNHIKNNFNDVIDEMPSKEEEMKFSFIDNENENRNSRKFKISHNVTIDGEFKDQELVNKKFSNFLIISDIKKQSTILKENSDDVQHEFQNETKNSLDNSFKFNLTDLLKNFNESDFKIKEEDYININEQYNNKFKENDDSLLNQLHIDQINNISSFQSKMKNSFELKSMLKNEKITNDQISYETTYENKTKNINEKENIFLKSQEIQKDKENISIMKINSNINNNYAMTNSTHNIIQDKISSILTFNEKENIKPTNETQVNKNNNEINSVNMNNLNCNKNNKFNDIIFKTLFCSNGNENETKKNSNFLDESPIVEKWNPSCHIESLKKNCLVNAITAINPNSNKNQLNNFNLHESKGKSHNKFIDNCNNSNLIKHSNFNKKNNFTGNNHVTKLVSSKSKINNFPKQENIYKSSNKYKLNLPVEFDNNNEYEITDFSGSSSDDDDDDFSILNNNNTPCFNQKKKKIVPKWATSKEYLEKRILEQNSIGYKSIFGKCKIDNLDLNILFSNNKKYTNLRGDSADWRLDNTYSSIHMSSNNKKNTDEINLIHVNVNTSKILLNEFNKNN